MNIIRIKGRRKWSIKKRLNVAPPTENPPHSHCTIKVPIIGMADTKLVITVAPQKDICPHGNTYPMKAVPIRRNKIMTPDPQVCMFLYPENIIPRLI